MAARQLALWANGVARDYELPPDGVRIATSDVRELCAAAQNAKYALAAIQDARTRVQDFPEDLAQFELTATDAMRLTRARLEDAELRLRTQDANARTCDDARVTSRIAASVKERAEALKALQKRGGPSAQPVLSALREADPSPEVRALASSLFEAKSTGP